MMTSEAPPAPRASAASPAASVDGLPDGVRSVVLDSRTDEVLLAR